MSSDDDQLGDLPEQEALIHRMCALDPARAGGWYVITVQIGLERVEARYRLQSSEREQTLVLLPASHTVDDPHVRTRSFRIVPIGDIDDVVRTLAEAVARQVARLERRFDWSTLPDQRRDVELYAVLDGVKPGLRRSAPLERIADVERHIRSAGLETVRLAGARVLGGERAGVVLAARDKVRAAALMELERRAFQSSSPEERRRANGELGLGLGYPECCVSAFCERMDRNVDGASVAEQYLAACDAWVAAPSPLLNNLASAESPGYFSAEPCRYDCPEAISKALAVRATLVERSVSRAAWLDRLLSCPLVIAPSGERFRVELQDGSANVVISRADPLPAAMDRPLSHEALARARALNGAAVDARGHVAGPGEPPARLFDFARLPLSPDQHC